MTLETSRASRLHHGPCTSSRGQVTSERGPTPPPQEEPFLSSFLSFQEVGTHIPVLLTYAVVLGIR